MKKNLMISKTRPLLLARTVPMPEDYPYPNAAIRMYFDNLNISVEKPQLLSRYQNEETTVVKMSIKSVTLNCECVVETVPDPILDIDTAGNLRRIKERPDRESEKEEWLNQARRERTRLAGSKNGQRLLMEYGKHNEVFNEAFQNQAFLDTWKEYDGLTEKMAKDTNESVKSNANVNDKVYKVTDISGREMNITYNGHAFMEKTALAMTLAFEYDFNNKKEFLDAAEAVEKFDEIVSETGNTDSKTTAIKPSEIYEKIEGSGNSVRLDGAAVQNEQDTRPPDSARRHRRSKYRRGDETLGYYKRRNEKWNKRRGQKHENDPDGKDEYGMNRLYLSLVKESVRKSHVKGDLLFKGNCVTVIGEESILAEAVIKGGAVDIDFILPDFELNIDTSGYDSYYNDLLSKYMNDNRFISRLVYANISNAIRDWLKEEAAQ